MKGRSALVSLCAIGIVASSAVMLMPASNAAASTPTTIVYAEQPSATPNYIFPFVGAPQDQPADVPEFQYLMFRPLYYFGFAGRVALDKTLSVANVPVFSDGGDTVTIHLRTYKWSNGTQVTALGVQFFLNMLYAEKTHFAHWVPNGISIPTSIRSIQVTGTNTIVLTLARSFNKTWFLDNQLSQITPFPLAWTVSATGATPGSAGCEKATFGTPADASACKGVYTYLSEQAGFDPTKPTATNDALPTYATNPLWQVVDGPFRLKSFTVTGNVVMVPNPTYSGPNKPTIKQFVEQAFTSTSAEYNALSSGQVDVGYLPTDEVTAATKTPLRAGPNNPRLASTFKLSPVYDFGLTMITYNFKSTGDDGEAGAIFHQLYFRQALEHLINQTLYIQRIYKGYAVPTLGPVPTTPKNPFVSSYPASSVYGYSPSKARDLLKSHGWRVVPGGVDVCRHPGGGRSQCGKGISKGARLSFTLLFAAGNTALKTIVSAEKAVWATVGIDIRPSSATFDVVGTDTAACPKGCSWELGTFGLGWVYTAAYPSGEELFETGAGANNGSFSTRQVNQLIRGTNLGNGSLKTYASYLAKQLPVAWGPNPAYELAEVHKGLSGVTPLSPLTNITPASWHWTT
jgi:peptide/nickel transport system substrate-binding protein